MSAHLRRIPSFLIDTGIKNGNPKESRKLEGRRLKSGIHIYMAIGNREQKKREKEKE